ncbi:MAG: hypothetical protein GXP41_06895 [Chloroflexi bacterium]|nr:hypothetical protein [Chloroflexota bacterium]
MSALSIEYRKNNLYAGELSTEPQLFAAIDLGDYSTGAEITDVPIYYRSLKKPIGAITEAYSTYVAGLPLERSTLKGLELVLAKYLLALIRFERFPEYVFHVAGRAWPIYHLSDQVVTRYPGSPIFSAPSVAELQVSLANHLVNLGYIKKPSELGILYLSPSDLQLYAPEYMLRAPKTADIPVYPTEKCNGKQLLTPGDSHTIAVSGKGSSELFALYHKVSKHLIKRGRLTNRYEMTVRRLAASTWTQMRDTLDPFDLELAYDAEFEGETIHRQVPVFTDGDSLVAARPTRRMRTALYFGPDIESLQSRLGKELYYRGITDHPEDVYIAQAQC